MSYFGDLEAMLLQKIHYVGDGKWIHDYLIITNFR